ncbi:MAG: hypothetical protein HY841_01815 [Bacteroidetes bacterium]|nr:hypothetical protein [Bacteroidota bacterium]
MNKLIQGLLLILLFFSCHPDKSLDDFKWFIGNWKGTMQEMEVHETWIKENEKSFSGDGFVLSDKDTLFHESTKLKLQGNDIVYIATVPGNPAPVSYKLTSQKKNKAIFENPAHDFPKIITYYLISPDSLIAVVEGDEDGKHRKEEFHFKKIN